MYDEINIRTIQGVGDIFWVYQKLSPYFKKINLAIGIIDDDCKLQKRALGFCKTLPQVNLIKFKLLSIDEYKVLEKSKKTITTILQEYNNNEFPIHYAVNGWLEDGIRIDEIDSDYLVEETIELKNKSIILPFEKYIILYISGNKISQEWIPEQYVTLIDNTFKHFNVKFPIILIGADYDEKHLIIAQNELIKLGYETKLMINYNFEEVNFIIKSSLYMLAYQSGLSILADNFNIPQTMLYFNFLKNELLFSWAKKKNISNNIYNAFKFQDDIKIMNNFDKINGFLPNTSN